ncbi:MAG: adenylosuccinate lyase family protein [Pseudomonadota bacterium]
MPTLVINAPLFGDMFGTTTMRARFSDDAMMTHYLEVWRGLARAQARLGVIPAAAGEAIERVLSLPDLLTQLDHPQLAARTQIVGYPILPLLEQLVPLVPNDHGQALHWGATTQDIMDTADVLQARAGLDEVDAQLARIATALADLAQAHARTAMAGRTHLQHALPVSFGFKCATWLAAIDRHRARLADLRPRLEVVQFAGAAGTLASLKGEGLAVQHGLARELRLGVPAITWHTLRDGFAETTGLLALVAGTLGKIGFDIMLMMQTETGEVLEPFVEGRGASSTMPQKRNPIASEVMVAMAKLVREQHSAMLDALVQDHERATGPWHVEWHALPSAFVLTSAALQAAAATLEGLEVRPDAMADGLARTGGLIVAEAVMMGLAPTIGRQVAHDVVYACCRRALAGERAFVDALLDDAQIAAAFSRAQIEALVDPAHYLGEAPEMVARLLAARKPS